MRRKKISKTIRLYKRHDLDLISFLDAHEMDFCKAVYCALTAFEKGEVFVIQIPPKTKNTADIKRRYEFHLRLDPEKDQAVLRMIDGITDGYKNNFIKNVLRLYLCAPVSEAFLKDKEMIDGYEAGFGAFRKNRRIVDAATVKKPRKKNNAAGKQSRPGDARTAAPVSDPDVHGRGGEKVVETGEKPRVMQKEQVEELRKELPAADTGWEPPDQEMARLTYGDPAESARPGDDLTDLFSSLLNV